MLSITYLFNLLFEQRHNRKQQFTMTSTRSLMRISSRTLSNTLASPLRSRVPYPAATFSASAFRSATPAGPPPAGFRLPRKERWDESKESALDKAGKYFLLTEMLRGMYVVLEQFFRPPYEMCLQGVDLPVPLTTSQLHNLLSVRKRPHKPPVSRRTCITEVSHG